MKDWHRMFVQQLMCQGSMSGIEVFISAKVLIDKFNQEPGFPKIDLNNQNEKVLNEDIAEFIDDLFTTCNDALEKVNFQIKRGKQEMKEEDQYPQCYTFVCTEENEQIAKMQKIYSEPELELLKAICELLADEKIATETKLINLCKEGGFNSTRKKLTPIEAEKVIHTFAREKYIINNRKHSRAGSKNTTYYMGARLILELENWLDKNIEVDMCRICGKPVFVSVECTTRNCNTSYHRYCVETKKKCKECKQPLKLDGVTSKR